MTQLPPQYVIGLVVLIVLVLVRLRPRPLTFSRLLIMPIVVLVAGTVGLISVVGTVEVTARETTFVIIDVVLSVVLGVVRALTVRVEGETRPLRYRYGVATLVLWAASVLTRFLLSAIGRQTAVSDALIRGSVLAMLGISLLAQNVIVLAVQDRLSRRAARAGFSRRDGDAAFTP